MTLEQFSLSINKDSDVAIDKQTGLCSDSKGAKLRASFTLGHRMTQLSSLAVSWRDSLNIFNLVLNLFEFSPKCPYLTLDTYIQVIFKRVHLSDRIQSPRKNFN